MSQGNEKDVQQLLELARDKSGAGRTRLVPIVGDLFFEENSVLSERERALMTDILRQLIHDVEMTVRKVLAERLADEPDAPPWAYNFFTGVPAPAGGGLVLLPMLLSSSVGGGFFRQPLVTGLFMVVVAGLMVSRIPTFAFKKFKVPNPWILPSMLFVGLFAATLVSAPWTTLSVVLVIYLASIPFSVRAYRSLKKKALALTEGKAGTGDDEPGE